MSPRTGKNDITTENKTKKTNNVLKVNKPRLGTKKFVTREVLRKNLRKLKKQKKNQKQTFPGINNGSFGDQDASGSSQEELIVDKPTLSEKSSAIKKRNVDSKVKKDVSDREKIKQRTKQLQIANKLEEKNIKKIEKQLKLNRRKSKGVPKSFVDDGLDFLLEVCDPEYKSKLTKEEFDFADNDVDFEEDLELLNSKNDVVNKKASTAVKKKKSLLTKDNGSTNDDALFNQHFSNSEDTDSSCETNDAELNVSESDSQSKNEDIQESSGNSIRTLKDNKMEIYQEDIYGRLRDEKGNLISKPNVEPVKYIPPGKRLATSDEFDADIQKLQRQLKGLLNRLAETNLPSIVSTIEKLYFSHSRHNMKEAIHTLVMGSLVGEVLSPERLIMEHCVLIAALHANVGTEVGAQFLELVVRKFNASFKMVAQTKELDNLILILSHMYNFGLVAAPLLMDILHILTEKFEEKDIELILIILRTVGFALRKDDPASLKEIIFVLQTKAGQATEQPARIRFMLEIILAIRNNNMTKLPNYDPSHTEHLRKLLRSLTKKGDALSKLNITYSELLAAENRGRWWIVGSAWEGQGPVAKMPSQMKLLSHNSDESHETEYSVELLEMARKQRMNTEVRRNIFCILMTAEDFVEAFERLMRLGLKSQQEREIVHVIMDCCLQERSFNPYYAYILQKLCHFHRRFQIASQFALWDHFKDLSSQSELQISHLSKLVVHLTLEGSLSLSVLKVIQFSEMDRLLVRFLRQILLGLLLNPSETAVKTVFARIGSSKFGFLKEGLLLFMHHFLMKNMEKMNWDDGEKLKSRIQMVQETFL